MIRNIVLEYNPISVLSLQSGYRFLRRHVHTQETNSRSPDRREAEYSRHSRRGHKSDIKSDSKNDTRVPQLQIKQTPIPCPSTAKPWQYSMPLPPRSNRWLSSSLAQSHKIVIPFSGSLGPSGPFDHEQLHPLLSAPQRGRARHSHGTNPESVFSGSRKKRI